MKSKTAYGADALSSRANNGDGLPAQYPRTRSGCRRGAFFVMTIAAILCVGAHPGCTVQVDDCVVGMTLQYASSDEPVADACIEFAATQSLEGQSPDEFLDSHSTFQNMTTASGGVPVRISISNRFGVDATHGIVDPIWIARIHLPDRTETIVFQRNYQHTTSDDIMLQQVGEFLGSMGDTIVVTRIRMVGCGSAVAPLNEGCTDEP